MTEPASNADAKRLRRSFKICRAAFHLICVAMVLFCLDFGAFLVVAFAQPIAAQLWRIWQHDLWKWSVGSLIFGSSVLGMIMLTGRWGHRSWRVLSGTLGLMAVCDIVLWLLHHGPELGLFTEEKRYDWMRHQTSMCLNWLEFGVMSALAYQVWSHIQTVAELKRNDAADAGLAFHDEHKTMTHRLKLPDADAERTSIWLLPAIGLAFWLVTFVHMTDWRRGWPLTQRELQMGEHILILLMQSMLGLVVALRVNFRCQQAIRRCSWEIRELDGFLARDGKRQDDSWPLSG